MIRIIQSISGFIFIGLLVTVSLACNSSSDETEYYTDKDFAGLKKIDAHTHVQTTKHTLVEEAIADNFALISLNCEVPDYPPIDSQQYFDVRQRLKHPEELNYLTTIETATRFEPGWAERQLDYLKKSFAQGAIGIKVWKNIGMTIKDKDSNFIMIDNPMFDQVFDYLERNQIPVCGHIGEPKACWLPYDQMTTNNDKSYFSSHPEYYMYLHPEYPSYEAQIQSRDNLLRKHPKLRFVGAHLGSLEWSVDEMANRLDRFPNMALDLAERMGHVQYQAIENWKKVHDFFIKYQDRIIYGTDLESNEGEDSTLMVTKARELWKRDWKYFTSGDTIESPLVNGKFKGLLLPKSVIKKIYFNNARKWYFK